MIFSALLLLSSCMGSNFVNVVNKGIETEVAINGTDMFSPGAFIRNLGTFGSGSSSCHSWLVVGSRVNMICKDYEGNEFRNSVLFPYDSNSRMIHGLGNLNSTLNYGAFFVKDSEEDETKGFFNLVLFDRLGRVVKIIKPGYQSESINSYGSVRYSSAWNRFFISFSGYDDISTLEFNLDSLSLIKGSSIVFDESPSGINKLNRRFIRDIPSVGCILIGYSLSRGGLDIDAMLDVYKFQEGNPDTFTEVSVNVVSNRNFPKGLQGLVNFVENSEQYVLAYYLDIVNKDTDNESWETAVRLYKMVDDDLFSLDNVRISKSNKEVVQSDMTMEYIEELGIVVFQYLQGSNFMIRLGYVDQNEQLILLPPVNVGRRGPRQMSKKGDIVYLPDPDVGNKGKIRFVFKRGGDEGHRLAFSDIIVTRTEDKVETTVIPDTTTTTSSTTSITTSSSTVPRKTTTTTTTSSTTSTTSTSESTTTQKSTTSSDKLTDSTTQLGTSTLSPVVTSTTTTTSTIEGSSTTGSSSTTTAPSTVASKSSSISSSSYIGAGVGGAAGIGLLGLVAYKARKWIFGSDESHVKDIREKRLEDAERRAREAEEEKVAAQRELARKTHVVYENPEASRDYMVPVKNDNAEEEIYEEADSHKVTKSRRDIHFNPLYDGNVKKVANETGNIDCDAEDNVYDNQLEPDFGFEGKSREYLDIDAANDEQEL